jgi:hypothetical protein
MRTQPSGQQCDPLERILDRFGAWYERELIDRPLCSIIVPTGATPRPVPEAHADLRDRWLDVERAVDRFEASLESYACVGDCVPIFWPNVGPDLCAAVFGCDLEFGEETSWSIPKASSIREVPQLVPDLDNPYWQAVRDMTDLSLQRADGRWVTSLADLHTNADLVAAIRDPQELCLDLMDDPDGVAQAIQHVTDSYGLMYDDLWQRIREAGDPAACMGAMHRERMYVLACDFIALISPDQFERAVLPALQRERSHLAAAHFHLDGPGALVHLPRMLQWPELAGIQWVFGAGRGPATRWLDVYREVQAAGKCVEVHAGDIPTARAMLDHLDPRGLWFNGLTADSVEEAEAFLSELASWAAR